MPWLCLLYLVSFLDRTNIGNARIMGLAEDANITPGQYNLAQAVFFISYAVFEPPSNVLLKKLRPNVWISLIVMGFGLMCMCIGFIQNFSGLVATRWFLGMFEAGLFPGCQYYLSCWYRRNEFGLRSAIFFSSAAAAGSFGGLLAAGIGKMDGVAGYAGWRWIFILEGIFTICVGVASYWMVRDFPDEAKFLTPDERLRVYYRLKDDQQSSAEHETFKWSSVKQSLTDWKTYTSATMFMGNGCSLYAVSLSLPTIVRQMGYSNTTAQLLTVPPYFVAAIMTILMSWIADRTRQRGYCTMATSGTGLIGFIILMSPVSTGAHYFALYLCAAAIYPCVPLTIAWVANNTNGTFKRGITIGIVIGWSNIQGVIGSNIYLTKWAPKFLPSHGICMAFLGLFLFGGAVVHRTLLARENRAKLNGERDYLVAGKSEAEIALIGDKRYVQPGVVCVCCVLTTLTVLISSTPCRGPPSELDLLFTPKAVLRTMSFHVHKCGIYHVQHHCVVYAFATC